ncbi:MAG: hypothetical protein MK110_13615 [Fuerstiella sp.]|nr:hypothetical protein [Fuerstiella sp.]
MNTSASEIVLFETKWWITSRGQTWGPFDYQWSDDLHGIEFTFQGCKFGEVCSLDEFFADLAPFQIPISVCRVATVVAGSLAVSLSLAESAKSRSSRLRNGLTEFGFHRFGIRNAVHSPGQSPTSGNKS